MKDSLVTVASFGDVLEANLAKGMLESDGIQAYLAGGEVASMAWHLTGAIGGIKLQVASRDEQSARALLAAVRNKGSQDDGEDWEAGAEEFGDDADAEPSATTEPHRELTSRDQTADRALRGALLGVLFFPIQFYVWWLLVDIAGSEESLAADKRHRAIVAAIISVPYLVVWLLLLGSFVGN